MCLVTPVKARLFAVFVILLGLIAQQRTIEPVVHAPVAVARLVAERSEHVQSDAVRIDATLRVAPAPALPRPLDPATPITSLLSWARVGPVLAQRELLQPGEVPSYFHSKRRIPRMNSDEPPRV